MKIVQVVSTLSYGDAVGNDVLALNNLIKKMGYKTDIYTENTSKKVKIKTKSINQLKYLKSDDIMIYHLAIGTKFNFQLPEYRCKKILMYHNITPPYFFYGYNNAASLSCLQGLDGLKFLSDKVDYCLAVSEFNKNDLINTGYNMEIDVLPILIPFDDYKEQPNYKLIKKYNDNFINILFVGRVVPNKKHQDIIASFYYYKKYINQNSRLIFVGSYDENDLYYKKLQQFIKDLTLEDVIFTGSILFKDILSYYHLADVFVCMSEHEGFCVPLVEAMYFDIPIIAYDSCAVPETLGDSGVIVKDKNFMEIAELINRVVIDVKLRNKIIENQKNRLMDFSNQNIENMFIKYISSFIDKNHVREK